MTSREWNDGTAYFPVSNSVHTITSIWPWCICPPNLVYLHTIGRYWHFGDFNMADFHNKWIWHDVRHDSCLLFKLCTKFGSNILYNRWERPIFVPDVRLVSSCELTSGSVFGHLGTLVNDMLSNAVPTADILNICSRHERRLTISAWQTFYTIVELDNLAVELLR